MIRLSTTQLWVHDQDETLAFYTGKLGFETRMDVIPWRKIGELSVAHRRAARPGRDHLVDGADGGIPGPPVMDAEDRGARIALLMGKGCAGTLFLTTDDCRASYEELQGR